MLFVLCSCTDDFYYFIEINNNNYFVHTPLLFNQVIFELSGNKITPKILCCFTEKLENKFYFNKKVKPNNDFHIHCTICLNNFFLFLLVEKHI
jgi:hypothetical protein